LGEAVESVVKLQLGLVPEAAVSGGLLIQSEASVFLLFNAMTPDRERGAGVGVVQFTGCLLTRFGTPNDEGRPEHPLYQHGLDDYALWEVQNSTWAESEMARARRSAKRIWGDSYDRVYEGQSWATRHFVATFHDSTFECLADDLSASVDARSWRAVANDILARTLSSP
jgi:hypothetical protein